MCGGISGFDVFLERFRGEDARGKESAASLELANCVGRVSCIVILVRRINYGLSRRIEDISESSSSSNCAVGSFKSMVSFVCVVMVFVWVHELEASDCFGDSVT